MTDTTMRRASHPAAERTRDTLGQLAVTLLKGLLVGMILALAVDGLADIVRGPAEPVSCISQTWA